MIKYRLTGRSISNVSFVLDNINRQTDIAFVTFANNADVELALEKVEGKKIRRILIKVFRSSDEQYHYYCNQSAAKNSLKGPNNISNGSLVMSSKNNSVSDLCK